MKKIYIRPVSEVFNTELGQVICASQIDPNGLTGPYGLYGGESPNGGQDEPGFGGYVDTPDGPPSTAKEFDLWGDW